MEKAAVTVKFKGVPEEREGDRRRGPSFLPPPLSDAASTSSPPSPRPRPALRTRAFTTGSLWEILSQARSAPSRAAIPTSWLTSAGQSTVSPADMARPVAPHSRLITDYVHMERRHRRRHWSEFDAAGSASPKGASFSPSPSSSIADIKSTASSSSSGTDGFLRPENARSRYPGARSREVQMRLDPRLGGASSSSKERNRNRNSLLASAYMSTSLTCLSPGKRRHHSCPSSDADAALSVYTDDDADTQGMPTYWRTPPPLYPGGMSFLGDSMRSISIYRKSSVNSTGSADDEPGGGGCGGCLTPSGTFNVSSGSSVSVPSYRIAVIGATDEFRVRLVDLFVGLGDADVDDDDVFADDEGTEKSAFVTLEGDEYYLTFTPASQQDLGSIQDVDSWVVVHNADTKKETTVAILNHMTGSDVTCGVLMWTGSYTSDAQKTEVERLSKEHSLTLLELTSLTPTAATMTLSRLVIHLQGAQRTGSSTPQLPVMRSRRMPGLSFHDVTVDKQTLFNRFFRRTLSTKSCDNLLAL